MAEVSSAAVTHTGLRRDSNEDAFRERPDLGLYVVADGMGGHEAGEVASTVAVDAVETFIHDTRDTQSHQPWPNHYDQTKSFGANRLRAALLAANRRVASAIASDATLKGMATTAAAVLLGADGDAHVAHVGDSRVYLLRDQRIQQLTHDHSWVTEQVRAGRLTDEAAQLHPWRHVVTRAISGGEDPDVETTDVPTQPGDVFLICSDGLSSVVALSGIEKLLNSWTPGPVNLREAADALIKSANDHGGPDNITVVLVQLT